MNWVRTRVRDRDRDVKKKLKVIVCSLCVSDYSLVILYGIT